MEEARADRRLHLLHLHSRRSQAAALRPGALQVLLSVPLQTLGPQDAHQKVSAVMEERIHVNQLSPIADIICTLKITLNSIKTMFFKTIPK